MEKNKKNAGLQIIKIICACLVVFVHYHFPASIDNYVINIGKNAVPVFFSISGYFLIKNSNITASELRKSILRKIKHIFSIVILAVVINAIAQVLNIIFNVMTFETLLGIFTFGSLFKFIVFNEVPIAPELWFLFALIYAYVFYYIFANALLNKKWFKYVSVIPFFIVYSFEYIVGKEVFLGGRLNNDYVWRRNWFCSGIPFLSFGIILKEYEEKIKNTKRIFGVILLVFGVVASGIEEELLNSYGKVNIFTFVILWGIYVISVNDNSKIKDNAVIEFLSDCTLYVYITHLSILWPIKRTFGDNPSKILAYVLPFVVTILSFALSACIVLLINKIKERKTAKQ